MEVKQPTCEPLGLDVRIKKYIEQMSHTEKAAYAIAQKNLESSFDIEKSIGFKDFMKKHNYVIMTSPTTSS
jgi:hypothetical protein